MDMHIIYSGKAKDYHGFPHLLWIVFMDPVCSRPVEKLESVDFNECLN